MVFGAGGALEEVVEGFLRVYGVGGGAEEPIWPTLPHLLWTISSLHPWTAKAYLQIEYYRVKMILYVTVEFHLGCSVEEGFWWKIGEWGRIHLVGSLDCNWQRQQVLTDCQRYFNRWHRMHFFRFSGIFWQIGNWCTLTAFLIFRCPLFQSNIPALLYSSRSARQAYRWPLYKLAEYFC